MPSTILYKKETKSSFEIKRETASGSRAEQFIRALRTTREFNISSKDDFIRLQNAIVDPRYAATDWRDFQNFVGETVGGYREVMHFICPKPEDVAGLMGGLDALAERVGAHGPGPGTIDPVVAAAAVSFAYVFIHPFENGNGRIHRYLIHRMLADADMTPPGALFPVPAAVVRDRKAYDAALETFSSSIAPFIQWNWSNRASGEITVSNSTRDLYRFFDATPVAEYLYGCVIETVRKDLPEEIDFIAVYDRALNEVRERIDMPDRWASFFVQACIQNHGRLPRKKRKDFAELSDGEVAGLEEIVREAMNLGDDDCASGTGPGDRPGA